jgi:hypothetical protein
MRSVLSGKSVRTSAVAFLAVIAGLEIGARADDWVRFGTPWLAPAVRLEELLVRDSLGMHARSGGWYRHFRINAMGFRGPEPRRLAAGERPVVVSGASETFGLMESPGMEWPAQLQARLDAQCGVERPDVLNAAFAGMSLPTVTQDIGRRVAPLRPAFVVYYPTPTQFLESAVPVAATPLPRGETPGTLSPLRLRFLPRLRDQLPEAMPELVRRQLRRSVIETARAGQPADWVFRDVPTDRMDAFGQALRRFVGVAKGAGARLLLVQHANFVGNVTTATAEDSLYMLQWQRFYPRAEADVIVEFDRRAADVVRQVATDSSVLLIDVRDELQQQRRAAFRDVSHFSDTGAKILASAVADSLLRHGVCATTR